MTLAIFVLIAVANAALGLYRSSLPDLPPADRRHAITEAQVWAAAAVVVMALIVHHEGH